MLRISKKFSLILSLVVSVFLFAICIGCAVILPALVSTIIEMHNEYGSIIKIIPPNQTAVLILAYLSLFVVVFADFLLFKLLMCVKSGNVFSSKSVGYIRGVSWCCFGLFIIFCLLGVYFQLFFVLAFVALFLGLCLRVVKNVIEEATEIKSENDLTV